MSTHEHTHIHARIWFCIAAILFFAVCVEKKLATTHIPFSTEEKEDIQQYVFLGYIGYILFAIIFGLQIVNYFIQAEFITYLTNGILVCTIGCIAIAIGAIFSEKKSIYTFAVKSWQDIEKKNIEKVEVVEVYAEA